MKLGLSKDPLPCLLKMVFSGVTSTVTVSWLELDDFCLLWTRQATVRRSRMVVTTEMLMIKMSKVESGKLEVVEFVSDSANK